MRLHDWSTGSLLPVCPLVVVRQISHVRHSRLAGDLLGYEEVSDTPDHLDKSRWSESR